MDEKAQAAREKKIKGDGDTAVATTSQPTRTTTAPSVDSVLDERRNALLREAA